MDSIETNVSFERRESLSFQLLGRCGRVGMVKLMETGELSEIEAVPMEMEVIKEDVVYSGIGVMCFRKVGEVFIFRV